MSVTYFNKGKETTTTATTKNHLISEGALTFDFHCDITRFLCMS